MTLKQTKRLIHTLAIGTAACMLLVLSFPQISKQLAIVMVLLVASTLVINLLFWRCPNCKKALGRSSKSSCQHCGEDLNKYF